MAARYRLRQWTGVALVPAAAFAVHQLRYLLAFGGLLTRLGRAWRTGRGEPTARQRT